MAVEPWNKVDIPCPGAASSSRITFNATTASIVESVQSHCEDVLKLLDSQVLQTEIRVLYEILYVVNNSFRQHKPFRAIKQVEQCIKRLSDMKLQGALQDLQELCPNKMQRDMGVNTGHCNVPSQPMLEWLCLKLLGASSLLVRTLDQCIKAFTLTRQHLRLAEFIVLNLVLVSMLSRLWVFFRGILRALLPLYTRIIELHQQVAQCWPMAYLTNFTLPGDLESFLSPSDSYLFKKGGRTEEARRKKVDKFSVLDKLFHEGEEEQVEDDEGEEREVMQMLAREGMLKSSMDLGTAIMRDSPHYSSSSSELNIKSLLQRTRGITKEHVAGVFKMASPVEVTASDPAVAQQKRVFLKQLRSTSSFREMAVQLKRIMDWCKTCKLRQERRRLAVILLQCQRRTCLDGEGISAQRKLSRTCDRIRRVMFKGTGASLPRSSFLWTNRSCFRSRFTALVARYGSVRSRFRGAKGRSRVAKDLFGVTAKSSQKMRRRRNGEELLKEKPFGGDDKQKTEEKDALQKPSGAKDEEIDDIFALIGF